MVGYRAGGLYWCPRTIEDSRGIPRDPPGVDESVPEAVDDLLEVARYPDHRQVRESVTSLDRCPIENGIQPAVEPTMRTDWIDRCAGDETADPRAPRSRT